MKKKTLIIVMVLLLYSIHFSSLFRLTLLATYSFAVTTSCLLLYFGFFGHIPLKYMDHVDTYVRSKEFKKNRKILFYYFIGILVCIPLMLF